MTGKQKTYSHPVLRHKKSEHISSNPDQRELALLRTALEAMEADPCRNHGILASLWPEINENRKRIERTTDKYYVSQVKGRQRANAPQGIFFLFYTLVKKFLEQSENKPHARSRTSFCIWLKAQIKTSKKTGIVRLLLDGDAAGEIIKAMSDRKLKDIYFLIRQEFFKNVPS